MPRRTEGPSAGRVGREWRDRGAGRPGRSRTTASPLATGAGGVAGAGRRRLTTGHGARRGEEDSVTSVRRGRRRSAARAGRRAVPISRRWRGSPAGSATASRRVIEGKPEVVQARPRRAARRGPPADRGRARRRQDDAEQGAGPHHRLHGAPDPVHARTCCPPTSPASRCSTRTPASSSSGPAASSPTSSSATRSTAPRPRPSRRCSSAWRSVRSPSTGRRTSLDAPFMVIATQNPIEMEGTYALPEAQRDRFMARVSMGYPVEAAEIAMLDSHTARQPARRPRAGHRRRRGRQAGRHRQRRCTSSEAVQRYAVAMTTATRRSAELMLGASPRATLHLVRAAKAAAALDGPRLRHPRRRPAARRAGARPPAAADGRGRR